ncbi:MAG TPA: maltose alpha-D-glucosyltransferase [Thermodesulfobacteriota bacterium]
MPGDPLWYKDAIIYQTHVKTFHDANGDGIGDFRGLTEKLGYLEGLGITALWLLPFYPSPLKDDGYDIADYTDVHPEYGSLRDFREFLREAHRRGIRVITELVINHTSDQHVWFQRARRARPGSAHRDFYVWSDSPDRYRDARIIFKDFETSNWEFDPVAKAYYWHRFYSHQPDLNFDSPQVRRAIFRVMDYWLDMGVDGLRLDAVPYLFEREGTNCENLPETYAFLRELRAHIDAKYGDRMLLAEANQWPEDAVAYFGTGDMCHMAFHFPLMPRMFMAVQMEDRFPIIDILDQTPPIPSTCEWALFLRNHDELTLEMVTDEERDYMYRVYARDPHARINLGIRRRLAPLLDNDRRKIELMNVLLFTLPGTPIIYYGDEIGMGDNYYLGDRDGVRTPMQWSADRNAGFSRANPQRLYLPVIIDPEYHYEAINVENQERNHASLLWWMRRLIAIRKRHPAFQRGTIRFLYPENPKVLAFVRELGDERILVVVNLSRHPQLTELDLSPYARRVPEEVFSHNRFVPLREGPTPITLGSYGYYMFALKEEARGAPVVVQPSLPEFVVAGNWESVLVGESRVRLERQVLPRFLPTCRWFGGKAREISQVTIRESIPVGRDGAPRLLFLDVEYTVGLPEVYVLPIAWVSGDAARAVETGTPGAAIARLTVEREPGLLVDGVHDERFRKSLLGMVTRRTRIRGFSGTLAATPAAALRRAVEALDEPAMASQVLRAEQSNSAIVYGQALILKLYRRLDEGLNPDIEIGRFLTESAGFAGAPAFAGSIEYRAPEQEPVGVAVLSRFVPNQGDAWRYTLDELQRYYERALTQTGAGNGLPELPAGSVLDLADAEIPDSARTGIGVVYLERAALLGQRTAEMHAALASGEAGTGFAPEPFSVLYQRSIYQTMQSHARQVFALLRRRLRSLEDEETRALAEVVLLVEKEVRESFRQILRRKINAAKIRIHGDYHLGQVLFTGSDFVVIDFEGEPARPLSERRLKRSPFRDVAGMLRSFHYAAYTSLRSPAVVRPEDRARLEPYAMLWYRYVSATFLRAYLAASRGQSFVPEDREQMAIMLNAFLLEKAVYEVGYELNNRPAWVWLPLLGIRDLLEGR